MCSIIFLVMSMHALLEQGKTILHRLQAAGHEAFFVGGAVRDHLLNRPIVDVDITTSASVEAVVALFDKTVLTGARYGTVTVLLEKQPFELTTYRTDGNYVDFRRPDHVQFTRSLKEDLKRRDFTINQLVMDAHNKIHDHHNGLDDLQKQCIRAIGKPSARFEEDALRMLRAFRFVAKLGFTIEPITLKAITDAAPLMHHIAIERVQDELVRIFNADYARDALEVMISSGFAKAFFNLEQGLKSLAKAKVPFDDELAFALLQRHHDTLGELFKFSQRRLNNFANISHLAAMTETTLFSPLTIFNEGLETCLKANHLNQMLGFESQKDHLLQCAKRLPIRHARELAFRGDDVLKHLKPIRKRWVGLIVKGLVEAVVNRHVENEYEALKTYAIHLKTNLEKSDNT